MRPIRMAKAGIDAKKFYEQDAVKKLQAARKSVVKNSTIVLVEGVQ